MEVLNIECNNLYLINLSGHYPRCSEFERVSSDSLYKNMPLKVSSLAQLFFFVNAIYNRLMYWYCFVTFLLSLHAILNNGYNNSYVIHHKFGII